MLVEVMGRHAGWIALSAGLASGAHMTLIPSSRSTSKRCAGWSSSASCAAIRTSSALWPRARNPPRARCSCAQGGIDEFGHEKFTGVGAAAGRRGGEADQEGGPRHGARTRAARRYADGRTTACWPPGSGSTPPTPPTRRVRDDGVAARPGYRRVSLADAVRQPANWCRRAATTTPPSSSAEFVARAGPQGRGTKFGHGLGALLALIGSRS